MQERELTNIAFEEEMKLIEGEDLDMPPGVGVPGQTSNSATSQSQNDDGAQDQNDDGFCKRCCTLKTLFDFEI